MKFKTLQDIKIKKRNGDIENFSENKMFKFLVNLGISQVEASDLIKSVYEEAPEFLKTSEVISLLVRVASRKISLINPNWEFVASKLLFAQLLNEKHNNIYPTLEVLYDNKNIDQNILATFSNNDIKDLNSYIVKTRDELFTYKAAKIFIGKYCRIKELPQITYMRVAMFLHHKSKGKERLEKIKQLYDALSKHIFTLATPIMVNALTKRPQMSSCVLTTTDDNTYSLLETNKNIGFYSANLAGVACDITSLRSKGEPIQNGKTSGPIPFLKMFEATINAWNQGGTRPGALAIYFPWWAKDVMDLLSLKSNGGTDENRARKLQYAIKLNQYFINAVMNDEEIALLSPSCAKDLQGVYGSVFEENYKKHLNDPNNKRIKARELWVKIFKERTETGNIYLYHEENVNNVSMLNTYIGSSNLCTEIVLPSRPAKFIKES